MWKRRREEAVARRVALDTGSTVVRMGESPDAVLLSPDGTCVGLEVVSVVDQQVMDLQRRMEETTGAISRRLLDEGLNRRVELGYDLREFAEGGYKACKAWAARLDLMAIIATTESGELDHRDLCEAGVQRLAWLSWRPSATPGVGWGYRTRADPGGTLVDLCLDKKHRKLEMYRKNGEHEFDVFWLAIDSLGPGTPEDGGFSMLMAGRYESPYDRVFLMIRGEGGQFSKARDVSPSTSSGGS